MKQAALLDSCFIVLASCLAYSSTLGIEVLHSSETSFDFYWTIQGYITEDRTLQTSLWEPQIQQKIFCCYIMVLVLILLSTLLKHSGSYSLRSWNIHHTALHLKILKYPPYSPDLTQIILLCKKNGGNVAGVWTILILYVYLMKILICIFFKCTVKMNGSVIMKVRVAINLKPSLSESQSESDEVVQQFLHAIIPNSTEWPKFIFIGMNGIQVNIDYCTDVVRYIL
jgi:hypothetical protein